MIDRHERYKQLVKQSARELRVKPSNEQAQRRATLLLARENLREALAQQLLAGSVVNPDTLVKIDALLGADLPAAPLPNIQVELVATDHQLTALREQNASQQARIRELEATVAARAAESLPAPDRPAAESQCSAAPADNVVPLPPSRKLTAEEIQQRRRAAGDTLDSGWQRPPDGGGGAGLYRDGAPGFGASRFDNPGWK